MAMAAPEVKTPVGNAPVIPLGLILIGGYLAWFGIHYFKKTQPDGSTLWPTTPIKDVLQGKSTSATADTSESELTDAFSGTSESTSGAAGEAIASGAAPGSGTGADNQAIGQLLAGAYGWNTGDEWNDLVSLWNQESGWNNTIWNGGSTAATQPANSSGAYGIAQALPYTKYPKAGWPPGYGGTADPSSQITWGLSYIKSTYGTPSAAWQHEQTYGNY